MSDRASEVLAARPAGHSTLWLLEFEAALGGGAASRGRIAPHRRALLALLANRPASLVTVVGAGPAADLAADVGVGEPVVYLGLAGLEIRGVGLDSLHPDARAAGGLLERLARSLRALTGELPGVRLESRGLALTLHVAEASPADADRAEEALYRVAQSHLSEHRLRCHRGAHAFELLPAAASGEAGTYRRLVAELERLEARPIWTVCVAGDVRGGPWFDALAGTGVSVAVGRRPSCARFRLDDPDAVDALLRRALMPAGPDESP